MVFMIDSPVYTSILWLCSTQKESEAKMSKQSAKHCLRSQQGRSAQGLGTKSRSQGHTRTKQHAPRPSFSFRKWIPPLETKLDRYVVQAGLKCRPCLILEVTQSASHATALRSPALGTSPPALTHLYMHSYSILVLRLLQTCFFKPGFQFLKTLLCSR